MWYAYHELPGMWHEIKEKQHKIPKARANIYVYSSTRFSGLLLKTKTRYRMICTKNDSNWMICQVCETKQTTLCSWSISHDVICIPRPASYVIRNQPHDVIHMETERPRVKNSRCRHISWMKVFIVGLINHVWYALEMIPGTAWYVTRKRTGLLDSCDGKDHSCQDPIEAYREKNPALQ